MYHIETYYAINIAYLREHFLFLKYIMSFGMRVFHPHLNPPPSRGRREKLMTEIEKRWIPDCSGMTYREMGI